MISKTKWMCTVGIVISICLIISGIGLSQESYSEEIVKKWINENPTWPSDVGPKKDFPNLRGKTIKIKAWSGVKDWLSILKMMSIEFNKLYPEINFELEPTWFGDKIVLENKVLAALVAGKGAPDIIDCMIQRTGQYWKGAYHMLFPFPLKEEGLYDNYVEARLKSYTGPDGKIYFLPGQNPVCVLYYRKDMFDEAGIATPIATWDEFLQQAKKLTKDVDGDGKIDQWALGVAKDHPGWFQQLLLQRGGGFFNKNGDVIIDNEIGVSVLKFYVDLIHKYKVALPIADAFMAPGMSYYKEGKVASTFSASWWGHYFLQTFCPEQKGKWRIQALPKWKEGGYRTATWGGTAFGVTMQSKYPEFVWQFLKYAWVSKQSQVRKFQITRDTTPVIGALKDPILMEVSDPYYGGQNVGKLWCELGLEVPPLYVSPMYTELDTLLTDNFVDVVEQKVAPREFLHSIAEDIRAKIR